MFQLKTIEKDAIPAALEKAQHYRLLNEPNNAESICLDVLAIDEANQAAIVTLVLARTDQFASRTCDVQKAREPLAKLTSPYDRAYYSGIIAERLAKMHLSSALPNSGYTAYELFGEAMSLFEQAEAMHQQGNNDATLRWNACARMLEANRTLQPRPLEPFEPVLDD